MSRRFYSNGYGNHPTIIQIDTRILLSGSSDSNSFNLKYGVNFYGNIKWGDGISERYDRASDISTINHNYAVPGIYDIEIKMDEGRGFQLYINNYPDRNKLIRVKDIGSRSLIGTRAYYGCSKLIEFNIPTRVQVSNNFSRSFRESSIETVSGFEDIDVSSIINMQACFFGALFNQDISKWNFNKEVMLENFMGNKTPANYNATYYSNLLIKFASIFIGSGRTSPKVLGMGTIKYTGAGSSARAALVADGWTITDGGLL